MLSPPKPLDEVQPKLVCESLTSMGHATAHFRPRPGEGSNGQTSVNFNFKVNFKDLLYQFLCLFSHMKYMNHIERDFHSVACAMPKGWDLGVLGVKN